MRNYRLFKRLIDNREGVPMRIVGTFASDRAIPQGWVQRECWWLNLDTEIIVYVWGNPMDTIMLQGLMNAHVQMVLTS